MLIIAGGGFFVHSLNVSKFTWVTAEQTKVLKELSAFEKLVVLPRAFYIGFSLGYKPSSASDSDPRSSSVF